MDVDPLVLTLRLYQISMVILLLSETLRSLCDGGAPDLTPPVSSMAYTVTSSFSTFTTALSPLV